MTDTRESNSTTNRTENGRKNMEQVANLTSASRGYHAVRFYEGDGALARIVVGFLREGLESGSPGIVVATPNLRAAFIQELTICSLDVAELQRSHDLLLVDAKEMLATFMTERGPDANRFKDQMCQVIEGVCRGRPKCTVRIFGQMVDILWQEGEQDSAIRLEVLWNQLAQTEAFSLLCGYAMGNFFKDATFEEVCGQHTHIVSADGRASWVSADASANRDASVAHDSTTQLKKR